MNIRISGAKLPRLNTIIATQVERAKLSQALKDQYKDADSFVVTDNGGLHLDYFPVFGLSKRANPIRYPRAALDKFFQVEDNRELNPVATETLKAQLDAWTDGVVKGQSIQLTENDIVTLVSSLGPANNTKFTYQYQINGNLFEDALTRNGTFVSQRVDVGQSLGGPVTTPAITRNGIIRQLLSKVNLDMELTEENAQLFADEIQLPNCNFVEGHSYVATIHPLALDYFGQIEFTIGESVEAEEPVIPVSDLQGTYTPAIGV